MTDYVKLDAETGVISYAPKNLGEHLNFNTNIELMTEYGYKPLVLAEKDDGKKYSITYKETKTQIKEIAQEIPDDSTETEEDRINHLTMTALDFINVLKSVGATDEAIEEYLNANLNIKHQLEFCQNVYCGVAKSLMPITFNGITITAEMVENAFKAKHGE